MVNSVENELDDQTRWARLEPSDIIMDALMLNGAPKLGDPPPRPISRSSSISKLSLDQLESDSTARLTFKDPSKRNGFHLPKSSLSTPILSVSIPSDDGSPRSKDTSLEAVESILKDHEGLINQFFAKKRSSYVSDTPYISDTPKSDNERHVEAASDSSDRLASLRLENQLLQSDLMYERVLRKHSLQQVGKLQRQHLLDIRTEADQASQV